MSKGQKNTIVWIVVALILVCSGVVLFFATRTSQENLTIDRTDGPLFSAPMQKNPAFIEISPGVKFKFDTGSDLSTLTPELLARLDSLGYNVRRSLYPVIGRDGVGQTHFYSERYTVDLPFYSWQCTADSLGQYHYSMLDEQPNVFRGVDFVVADNGVPTLGIDFIEKFKVEYICREGMLSLYTSTPEGYEVCEKIKVSHSPSHWIKLGHRYSMEITVNRTPSLFFIDTGVRRAFVKMPMADLPSDSNGFLSDTVSSYLGQYDCQIDTTAWLQIGNREGRHEVYYFNNLEEAHSFNPLNVFFIDVVIDFPGRQLLFRR